MWWPKYGSRPLAAIYTHFSIMKHLIFWWSNNLQVEGDLYGVVNEVMGELAKLLS
jgi:hypothetical protein